MNLVILREKENLRKKNSSPLRRIQFCVYLKSLSDAAIQEIATNVADRPHHDDNPHLEDSQPQDDLDKLPVPKDSLPHGEDNSGLVQLEEDDNGIHGPQPKDDQQLIDVSENNLVEVNNTFLSTSHQVKKYFCMTTNYKYFFSYEMPNAQIICSLIIRRSDSISLIVAFEN